MKSTPGRKVVVANSGANRQQQREQAKKRKSSPQRKKSIFMRIFIGAIAFIMLLGVIMMCLR